MIHRRGSTFVTAARFGVSYRCAAGPAFDRGRRSGLLRQQISELSWELSTGVGDAGECAFALARTRRLCQ